MEGAGGVIVLRATQIHEESRYYKPCYRAATSPATLPNHPDYPMGKAVDSVHGQPLANDPGQTNAVGDRVLAEAAPSENRDRFNNKGGPGCVI